MSTVEIEAPNEKPVPPLPERRQSWLGMLWVVVSLELAQRVRSVAWYVLLGVVAAIVGGIIVVLFVALQGYQQDIGGAIFSTTLFLVMLVTSLVTPALAGNAINGERESGTLASTQVTQVTSTQLVLGKVIACWIASLGFLAVCTPFMLASAMLGGLRLEAVLIAIPMVVFEIGVVSAIAVGCSGVIRKPVMSTAVSYLIVALFSVGTLIGFGVGSVAFQTEQEYAELNWDYDEATQATICIDTGRTFTVVAPRPDRVWWMLAANPFIMMADAVPAQFDSSDNPTDAFGQLAMLVRLTQHPPTGESCADYDPVTGASSISEVERYESSVPSWFVGVAIHLLAAVLAVWAAIAATRAPARRLAPGSRIA